MIFGPESSSSSSSEEEEIDENDPVKNTQMTFDLLPQSKLLINNLRKSLRCLVRKKHKWYEQVFWEDKSFRKNHQPKLAQHVALDRTLLLASQSKAWPARVYPWTLRPSQAPAKSSHFKSNQCVCVSADRVEQPKTRDREPLLWPSYSFWRKRARLRGNKLSKWRSWNGTWRHGTVSESVDWSVQPIFRHNQANRRPFEKHRVPDEWAISGERPSVPKQL